MTSGRIQSKGKSTSALPTTAPDLAALAPMLLNEVPPGLAPDGDDWTAELKFDGYRLLAAVDDGRVRLRTRGRNGRPADATRWYPELQSIASLPPGTVIDGEVCVLDSIGRSDFERLQARSVRRGRPPSSDVVTFCAFDLLFDGGVDVRSLPLAQRKAALQHLLTPAPAAVLFVTDLPGKVRWLYAQAVALRLEGVVAKRLTSTYQTGLRSADWLKVKRPGAVPPERFHFRSS